MKKMFLLLVVTAGLLFACKHQVITPQDNGNSGTGTTGNNNGASGTSNCDTIVFTYSGAVKGIMQNNCVACHAGSLKNGGVDLSTYNGVKSAAVAGTLIGTISHASGYLPMPQGGDKLSDCNITQIQKWIDSGTLNN
jgi:mono/diheme cytochrome c family protein